MAGGAWWKEGKTGQGPDHTEPQRTWVLWSSHQASCHGPQTLPLTLLQRTLGPKSSDLYCKPAFHSLSCSLILGFFHFRKEDKADGGDGCTTMRMYLMPPNCTLKMTNKLQRMYTSQQASVHNAHWVLFTEHTLFMQLFTHSTNIYRMPMCSELFEILGI